MGRVFIQTFEHSNIQTFLNFQLPHSITPNSLTPNSLTIYFVFSLSKKNIYPLALCAEFMIYYASLSRNTGLWRNWLAHWTVDPGVAGSSPVDPASTERSSEIASWCNGSTADSDSACWGSSPCEATIKFPPHVKSLFGFVLPICDFFYLQQSRQMVTGEFARVPKASCFK